jgi:pimeloyl-ACP methyl ester carboxylesterase
VSVAYADWGPADAPVVLCCGGVANVAMRFNYLAADLSDRFRVICMDWLGRGRSGWMADRGRLLAGHLCRAAAPDGAAPGRPAGHAAGLVDGRQRGHRADRAPPRLVER